MPNDNEQTKADHPLGWNVPNINDLRSAIAHIKQFKGQYIETDRPVDPIAELAGVYRYIGAGGTVMRPTRIGPAMTFNNVKGYPNSRSGGNDGKPRAGKPTIRCAYTRTWDAVGQSGQNGHSSRHHQR